MNNTQNAELKYELNSGYTVDAFLYKKMSLMFNAIEDGWSVKKNENSYIFTKKHENKKEVFNDAYLTNFLQTNMTLPTSQRS
jgi:hypothetical protein